MPVHVQSVTVPNNPSGGTPTYGTVSQVGVYETTGFVAGTVQTSLGFTSLNPADLIVAFLGGGNGSAGTTASAVGSPNSSGWEAVLDSGFDANLGGSVSMWVGSVVTATADTLNVTWTGSPTTTWISVVQFTTGQGPTTQFNFDSDNTQANASSTTVTWPSLTPPTGATDFYFGTATTAGGGIAGSTSGYTYKVDPSTSHVFVNLWNPSISAASQPTCTQTTAKTSRAVGEIGRAFIVPSDTTNSCSLTLSQIPTGRMWVISQIGFEILPASNLTGVVANVVFNGRALYPNINANGGFVQGPPWITVRSGDNLTVNFTGAPIGSSMVANFLYNEYPATTTSPEIGGLV